MLACARRRASQGSSKTSSTIAMVCIIALFTDFPWYVKPRASTRAASFRRLLLFDSGPEAKNLSSSRQKSNQSLRSLAQELQLLRVLAVCKDSGMQKPRFIRPMPILVGRLLAYERQQTAGVVFDNIDHHRSAAGCAEKCCHLISIVLVHGFEHCHLSSTVLHHAKASTSSTL